jgi:dipeptidyl aminopeptidase/acylaminoacyl peptidase
VINADGSGQRQVSHDARYFSHDPFLAWSPDGSLIAAEDRKAGEVDFLRLDGTVAMRKRLPRRATLWGMDWSPNGRCLAAGLGVKNSDVELGVYLVPISRGPLRKLPKTGVEPAWSPGERRLLFVIRDGDMTTSASRLYVLTLRTGIIRDTPLDGFSPAWSRRRNLIAYVRSDVGIWVAREDGSRRRRVVAPMADGRIGWPQWSPDGRSLSFVAGIDSPHDARAIYLVREDGSGLRHLCEGRFAVWRPERKRTR